MTEQPPSGLADGLANLTGQQILDLLNEVHTLHAEQVAQQFGLTDPEDLAQLSAAPDRDAMITAARSIQADHEYEAFYPSEPAEDAPAGYEAYFPKEHQ